MARPRPGWVNNNTIISLKMSTKGLFSLSSLPPLRECINRNDDGTQRHVTMWGGDKHHYQWPGDGALRLDMYMCVDIVDIVDTVWSVVTPGAGPGLTLKSWRWLRGFVAETRRLRRRLWRGLGWGHQTTDTGFTRTQDTGVEWGNCNHMTDINWDFCSEWSWYDRQHDKKQIYFLSTRSKKCIMSPHFT